MAVLDIRQRTGYLFLAVTVGHIVLISTQVNTQRGVPLFEAVVFGAFAEVQRTATSIFGATQNTWENYFALQQVRAENERLRSALAQLQIRLQEERVVAQQTRTLQSLLELRERIQLSTVAVTVIASGASPDFRTVTVDKGTGSGLARDMAVIAPQGVVGRVIMAGPRAAKVQLLIDRNAAAGVADERSRAQGVAVGIGTDRLKIEYVSGTADVKVGDMIVTSGIDGIYPKGFAVGQIESIQRSAGEYSAIVVRPAVDFSTLEAALVVTTPPDAARDGQQAPAPDARRESE